MADPVVLGSPAAAAAPLPKELDKPAYVAVLEQVQHVWNAFIACIVDMGTRFFTWCASWIITSPVGPAPVDKPKIEEPKKPEPVPEPVPEEDDGLGPYDAGLTTPEALVKWYRKVIIPNHKGTSYGHGDDPKKTIDGWRELFLVASPLYTNARHNYTDRLLRLGADPNSVHTPQNSMTPLRCAVLTGCWLAYETLRKAGASPYMPYFHEGLADKSESTMELVHRMALSPLPVRDFFKQEVQEGEIPFHCFGSLSGTHYRGLDENWFGTKADITKMIDYEVRKIIDQISPTLGGLLSPPLVKLIAEHLTLEPFT